MKFGKKLIANATNEWQSQFIDYKLMKKKAKAVRKKLDKVEHEKQNAVEDNDIMAQPQEEVRIIIPSKNRFFTVDVQKHLDPTIIAESGDLLETFEAEIDKINRFFKTILSECKMRHDKLVLQMQAKEKMESEGKETSRVRIAQLRKAFQEHYRSLVLLENYRSWNFLGCGKSIKKFVKCSKCTDIQEPLTEMVREEPFFSGKELDSIMYDTVTMFMSIIRGSRKRAMNMLRIPVQAGSGPNTNSTILRCGILFGTSIMLCVVCAYIYIRLYIRSLNTGIEPGDDLTFLLFRLLFFPVALTCIIALNVKIWSESNINYVFIFEMDARRHLTMWEFSELSLVLFLLWTMFLTLYLFLLSTLREFAVPFMIPVSLLVLYILFLIFPSRRFLYGSARKWLASIILKSIMAPFVPVRFQDFWFVNQCTSLSDVLFDMQFIYCLYKPELICYISNRYFVTILMGIPIWLRLMQCIRRYRDSKDYHQLLNIGKYCVTIFTMVYTFIFKQALLYSDHDFDSSPMIVIVIWFGLNIINTLYKYMWDLIKDWGLLRVWTFKHFLLRTTLMQRAIWYYLAMIYDLVARLLWLIIFLLRYHIPSMWWDTEFMLLGITVSEIMRRFIWNIFRLENEHLHNADNFRVVSEIPLPFPMDVEANEREDQEYRQQVVHNIKTKLTSFSGPLGALFRRIIMTSEDEAYSSDEESEEKKEKPKEKPKPAQTPRPKKEEAKPKKLLNSSKSVPASLNRYIDK